METFASLSCRDYDQVRGKADMNQNFTHVDTGLLT